MRPEDILDAIGEVDEAYIRQAKQKKSSYKWIIGTAAACLALALAIPAVGVASNSDSFGNESARDEIWNEMAEQQESQDIAIESGVFDQKDYPENWCQAEIHEYGSETVMAYCVEKSMELQAVLKRISARDSDSIYEEPDAWDYSIQMTDSEGNVTKYVLRDNGLYNCTEFEYRILDAAELASLREAMGLA